MHSSLCADDPFNHFDRLDVSGVFTAAQLPALQRQRVCKRRPLVDIRYHDAVLLGHAVSVY